VDAAELAAEVADRFGASWVVTGEHDLRLTDPVLASHSSGAGVGGNDEPTRTCDHIHAREQWPHHSHFSAIATAVIAGGASSRTPLLCGMPPSSSPEALLSRPSLLGTAT
jgi:hypothetical protein